MVRFMSCALAVIFIAFVSPEAKACACGGELGGLSAEQIRASVLQEFAESVEVFSGEVISLDTLEVKFKAETIWKGELQEEITISTGARKVSEELISRSSCDYRFEVGRKYLVFSKRDGELIMAQKCGWTQSLEGSEQIRKIVEQIRSGEDQGSKAVAGRAKSNNTLKPTANERAF